MHLKSFFCEVVHKYLVYTDDWFLISGGLGLWNLQKMGWIQVEPFTQLKTTKTETWLLKTRSIIMKNSNGIILEQGGSVVFAHIQSFLTFEWKNI